MMRRTRSEITGKSLLFPVTSPIHTFPRSRTHSLLAPVRTYMTCARYALGRAHTPPPPRMEPSPSPRGRFVLRMSVFAHRVPTSHENDIT